MKKLIRWLSDVSGVTKEIQKENTKFIGHQMHDAGYWFSAYPCFMVCIQSYAEKLKEGQENLFAFEFEKWRKKVLNSHKQL